VAGLLFQDPKRKEVCFQPIVEKLVAGRLSKSELNPEGSDLACDDEQMSRHHFEIRFHDGFFVLRDLQSRNGTYVNERPDRVSKIVLKEGDVIHAGTWTFIFAGA
jgi:pSer/pThr/pTyr-binding forkhead associated (FHA) protein